MDVVLAQQVVCICMHKLESLLAIHVHLDWVKDRSLQHEYRQSLLIIMVVSQHVFLYKSIDHMVEHCQICPFIGNNEATIQIACLLIDLFLYEEGQDL